MVFPPAGQGTFPGLSRDPQGSVYDFGVEVVHLVKLGHHYLPIAERDLFNIEYLMCSLGNKALQIHSLTANTSTIASTVLTIETYLAIDSSGWPDCKVTRGKVDDDHLENVVSTLSTLSALLASQSEALATVMARLEVIEQSSRTPQTVRSYN